MITPNNNEIECECRLYVSYDGTHDDSCDRDGCNVFDQITSNKNNIKSILSFITDVHLRLKTIKLKMGITRIDL